MSKKRNKRRNDFRTGYRPAFAPSVGTAVMTMPAPAEYAEPEYIPPVPESDLTPEEEAEVLAEIRNMPDSYPTDEEIAEFQAEYPPEPSYDNSDKTDNVPYQITAMEKIFQAVNELNDGDFTDSFLALSEKAEQIAEYGRQAFIMHGENNEEVVNLDMVYEFNQAAMRRETKHGSIISAFVMKDGNADCGWEDKWKSIDLLLIEKERWNTAYRIEDFGYCIPIANKGMTAAEMFAETRRNYAETALQ